jgi:hypothetical protein
MDEKEKTPIEDVEAHRLVPARNVPTKAVPARNVPPAADEAEAAAEAPDVEAHRHVPGRIVPGKTVPQ